MVRYKKNFIIYILILGGFLSVIFLGQGCRRQMNLSRDFGKRYEKLFSAQVINPDAPENKISPDGYPGRMADKIYKKVYEKSMTEPKEKKESVSKELKELD